MAKKILDVRKLRAKPQPKRKKRKVNLKRKARKMGMSASQAIDKIMKMRGED